MIEQGLHYNWHRFYDPTTGTYTQPDPLGFIDGPSIYAYAGNNPVTNTDETGLCPPCAAVAAYEVAVKALALITAAVTGAYIGNAVDQTILNQSSNSSADTEQKAETLTANVSCQEGCPPYKIITGKLISIGQIAHRPMDNPASPQHGIIGPHFNIYEAKQAPKESPASCDCFWVRRGAVSPENLPPRSIPIEPFDNAR